MAHSEFIFPKAFTTPIAIHHVRGFGLASGVDDSLFRD